MIIGTIGRLGTGKTLGGVVEGYRDFRLGRTIFSNIWLGFPHIPIKDPYDFITIENGFCLGDELWALADNRKSQSLLSDVVTILCIRSRRKDFDVFYTQQYLQIDVRIRFITDFWIKSQVLDRFGRVVTNENKLMPEYLIQKVYDGDLNPFPIRYVRVSPYLKLFNTRKDPYTLSASLTDESLKRALDIALSKSPRLGREMDKLEDNAKKSERVKKDLSSLGA